ncbi:MAG: zinc ABC transporter substrate-binding protein, partial [Desulfofustis sp.]|nr:zinc ABC transporter substrate-binding protein [Desulfofustis sp.]
MLAETKPTVFVSILPQKFFVQQISGELVDVEVMVPPGASPHTYEPKPSQMRKMAKASVFFTIGIALEEAWLERITKINPDMSVVHTEAGIVRIAMSGDHHHEDDGDHKKGHREDDHGERLEDHERDGSAEPEGHGQDDHGEDGLDPHIWLSPVLVKRQAEVIGSSLENLDPKHAATYRANNESFMERIDELDAQLRNILDSKKRMKFMVFHPSWGYFAQSYGLEQVPVEIEGKSPKPAHLRELIELARQEQISVIFAQPQ